jgi:hypothetical protein
MAHSAILAIGGGRNDDVGWRLVAACAALPCFVPAVASAEGWEIKPSISTFETFTSNARLDPPGHEKADFATTLSPAIDIHRDAPRLKLDLNYALDAIGYAEEEDLSELRNRLHFASTATVVPETVFIDSRAGYPAAAAGDRAANIRLTFDWIYQP